MGKRGLFSSWAILLSDPRLLSVNRACIANCSNVRRLEGLSKQTAQVPLVLSSGVCWRSGYDHTEAVLHIRLRARTMRNGFGPVIFKSSEFLPIHRRGVGRPHPRNFASNNSTASTKANGVNMGARAPSLFFFLAPLDRWIFVRIERPSFGSTPPPSCETPLKAARAIRKSGPLRLSRRT